MSIKDRPANKPQVARLVLAKKTIEIGGVANVFPTPDDVQRFVDEVRRRIAEATEGDS